MMTTKMMISYKEFFQRYKLSKSDFYRLCALRIFPNTFKIDGKAYISDEELEKFDKKWRERYEQK